jgi:hypothetical protein
VTILCITIRKDAKITDHVIIQEKMPDLIHLMRCRITSYGEIRQIYQQISERSKKNIMFEGNMGTMCSKLHTVDLNQNGISDIDEIINVCVGRVLTEVLNVIKPDTDVDTGTT